MHSEDVKRVRRTLACSVGELAATLGVDVPTVLAWEAGDLFPTKRHADRMKALEHEGPDAVKRLKSKRKRAPTGVDLLADPRLWAIVRKLLAHPDLFAAVEKAASTYDDPVGNDGG